MNKEETLTIESAQARLESTLGKTPQRVIEVQGNAYKIAGSHIWRSFPKPPPPEKPTRFPNDGALA